MSVKPSRSDGASFALQVGTTHRVTFERREKAIPVSSDVHSWMQARVWVLDHPWFATTGEAGTFTITDVPVGRHTLHAWHETFGTTTAEVTVTEGGTAEVELSLSWR